MRLKKGKKLSNGEFPIYARITLDGKRVELSTKKTCEENKWDTYRQELKGRSEHARTINHYLMNFKNQVQEKFNELERKGIEVNVDMLKGEITGTSSFDKYLLKVFQENNILIAKETDNYSKSTLGQYATTLDRLEKFIIKEYKQNDIKLNSLNLLFIRKFDIYLKSEFDLKDNTIAKHLKQLKKVIHYAMSMKYIDADPFFGYKIRTLKATRQYLTKEELQRIENHKFRIQRLERVRDIFVFVCYTGLSYSDLKEFTGDKVIIGIDGNKWINYKRAKTGVDAKFPLLTPAQKILDKYVNDPECNTTGLLLPVKSNQRLNSYLSEIAELCEIDKHITMHIARHTFASTITLANNIPIETVSKMLGHTDIKTTQLYAKVIDTKIAEDMKMLEKKLKSKTG
jgi:site-specific recombinase XerD